MNELSIKKGLVINRESTRLEFKLNFNPSVRVYIKSICAFANSRGGKIIFGIQDKPRTPIGLNSLKYKVFNDFDPKDLMIQLQHCLSENIEFNFSETTLKIRSKNIKLGILEINESSKKPIICRITDPRSSLREGAIYYRYNGKSEEIKAQDLINLIQDEKEKEKKLFMSHIEKIAKIGVSNTGVFSYDGEMFVGDQKILFDKDVISKIKFIREGEFVEKNGATALILKGEIVNAESTKFIDKPSDPNFTHPFEGLSAVIEKIKKGSSIKLIERNSKQGIVKDSIYINYLGKTYSLKHLIPKISKFLKLDSDINYCWHNEKKTVRKYNIAFVEICIKTLKSEDILKKIL